MQKQAIERANHGILEDDWFSDSPVPELLEDETVYSWCARYHLLNGSYDSRATSRVLFGHSKAGLRHDIPGYMGAFQERTQSALGNSRDLLKRRTLFCFHSPFLTMELEDMLLNRLITGDNVIVRKQLGLERSGLLDVAPLKFCPECVTQQIQASGVAWWQISQQLPPVFICPVHGERLRNSVAKQHRGVYSGFQTPLECLQRDGPKLHAFSPADREQLISLANWGYQLQMYTGMKFADETLRYCYLLKAKSRGWLSFDGSVRMQKVRDEFTTKYDKTLQLFGREFLGELDGVNAGFLAYMFRRLPSRRYPLKHILLMNFLFDSFEDLIEIKRKVEDAFSGGGEAALNAMLCDGRTALLKLVIFDGLPVSRAAVEVGVSSSSAIKFLKKRGVKERLLRPRIVGTEKEQNLRSMLIQGLDRSEISKAVGVSLVFIKDYLAGRSELKKVWTDANRAIQIQIHRSQLLTILKQYSDLPIKSIRRLPKNGFQWLYINDRAWLQEVLPAIWKR